MGRNFVPLGRLLRRLAVGVVVVVVVVVVTRSTTRGKLT